MTFRFTIECNDCSTNYIIRYGLGNNYPQSATFECPKCLNKIKIGYEKPKSKPILEGFKLIDNNDENENLEIINLHPEIPTDKNRINDPYLFQTLELFSNIKNRNTLEGLINFKKLQLIWSNFNSEWEKLKPLLRIVANRGKKELYNLKDIEYEDFTIQFHNWLGILLSGKTDNNFHKINKEFNLIDNTKLKVFVTNQTSIFQKIYSLCNTYMIHSEYLQSTIFHQKYDWETNPDMVVNVHWEDIESVYGDLYEIVGDLLVIPTIINNLREGRKYDEFKMKGFTLNKYLHTDKANRGKNFEQNPNLQPLTKFYYSWLRNGTHHKNSFFNSELNEITLGVGKGGGSIKKISLIEYVKATNELFETGLILSSLILHLNI